MCGLTGFARNPKGNGNMDVTLLVFQELMSRISHRGTHATGVAVQQNGKSFIWKKAAPVNTVLKSPVWTRDVIEQIDTNVTVVQGHVRWATHANAHLDSAAHPFQEGKIIGAHNGIISNWKDIADDLKRTDWINDSQAPFGLLDTYKNPVKALDELDGYWALTWTKGASLFFARTDDAPLSAAYVPSMQTMFWNSEERVLASVLKAANLEYDLWAPNTNTIYRYTPSSFSAKTTNAEKTDAPFRGRKSRKGSFNSSRPSITATGSAGQKELPLPRSTRTTIHAKTRAYDWDETTAREIERPRVKRTEPLTAGQLTLKDINARFTDMMSDAFREIDDLKGRDEVNRAEIDHLRSILDANGLLEIADETEDDSETITSVIASIDARCSVCERAASPDAPLLEDVDGSHIHHACLLSDGHIANATGAA